MAVVTTPPPDTASSPALRPVHAATEPSGSWWRDAVIYQVYPRSWADSNGDGVGDLAGITARLPHLKTLGVDAVWLSPFYVSPMHDAGYDVADYRDVDPLFGSLADADALIEAAHGLGLKVIADLVPNHSSSEHPWFRAALESGPGSPERARYIFRDGLGDHGAAPPNDWGAMFGGPAWTRVTEPDGAPGQWYLHLFDVTQPDFDWTNPEVREEFLAIVRFWLDRGIDGFRVDVANGLVKMEGLPDWDGTPRRIEHPAGSGTEVLLDAAPMWDQEGVHKIYRTWRRVVDEYTPERLLCAEAWSWPETAIAQFTRPGEMHQAFNFLFLDTPWLADDLRAAITRAFEAFDPVGTPPTWVLSNHDVVRHASRLGLDQSGPRPNGIGAEDQQPDAELGLRRARAATALLLALPGSAYLYQGEELGLPEHTTMPNDVRQDPTFFRSNGGELGRDGCRVPMPWESDAPSLGFGPGERTWLPQPDEYSALAVDAQDGAPDSTLELYRLMLRLRREQCLGHGGLAWHELSAPSVLAFVNASADGHRKTLVVANLGDEPLTLPREAEVILASGSLSAEGAVPTDVTVWAQLLGQ